jgi:hypothetical protein
MQIDANSDSKLTEDIHDDQKRDKILKWISSSNFPSQQSDLIARRQEGTGLQFLLSPEFVAWRDGPKQSIFCPGMPGAGKTMMAAITIDHLSKTIRSRSAGLAYIFCNYKTQGDQNVTNLLGAILKQLVQDRPTMPYSVSRLYEKYSPRGTSITFEDCIGTLESVCGTYPAVYIIVDALDECSNRNDGTRSRLLKVLFDLQRIVDVRLMVTSRSIPDIVEEFLNVPMMEIRATAEDVKQFVSDRIYQLPKCVRGDDELKRLVMDKVVQAADGMLVRRSTTRQRLTYRRFLLTSLYIESLQDMTTKKQVKMVLERIAESNRGKNVQQVYDQAYDETLRRIDTQPALKAALARRALSWIAGAKRHLSVQELCTFLALEPNEDDLENIEDVDVENIPAIEDVISVCAGLLVIDVETDVARLVHYTTQEYFQRKLDQWAPNSQKEITITCLVHLIYLYESEDLWKTITGVPPTISGYAARYWGWHAQQYQADPVVTHLAFRFLKCGRVPYPSPTHVYGENVPYLPSAYVDGEWPLVFGTALHLMTFFRLLVWLVKLSDTEGSRVVNQLDTAHHTPLMCAAAFGNDDVLKILLSCPGVDINMANEDGHTALIVACSQMQERVVELLLKQDGINVTTTDELGHSALWHAAGSELQTGVVFLGE